MNQMLRHNSALICHYVIIKLMFAIIIIIFLFIILFVIISDIRRSPVSSSQ